MGVVASVHVRTIGEGGQNVCTFGAYAQIEWPLTGLFIKKYVEYKRSCFADAYLPVNIYIYLYSY